nr:MAG TPA: hypothetical protein [Caudoviricetes sp.]
MQFKRSLKQSYQWLYTTKKAAHSAIIAFLSSFYM